MGTNQGREGRRAGPAAEVIDVADLLRLLIESVKDYAIFALDPHGRVLTWNSGAERMKRYRADDIIGHDFSVFYTPEDLAAGRPHRLLTEALGHGQSHDEGWRVRKDGSRFWANVVITPLFEGDEHVGFAKVTHDETERRAAEERIRELELTADRERIAGQLAGTIVHRTFEAGLSLQGTLSLVSDPVVTKHIDDVISLLDDMLRDLRAAIMDLDE